MTNKDQGKLKEKILQEWPDLNQKDLGDVLGNRDQLIQKLVREYGISHEEAERRLNEIDA
ncbi:CsbD family protein [Isachenkonia alkalipeptolytica]|uniref:CsbD family protein n=1 Tax=Isachenkonia alkalipeptolytica TaxID=2565777 RepID=A0AA43XM51_9CLOT|nr:CsbD family protein [Isachenkonia alkalipeptolytica]NBG88460.1 CsbD family protein [Isachenkonia alkalipeptolytica]